MEILNASAFSTEGISSLVTLNSNVSDTICVLKIGVQITNENRNGLISFSFAQTIKDNLGNSLAAPLYFVYNKI